LILERHDLYLDFTSSPCSAPLDSGDLGASRPFCILYMNSSPPLWALDGLCRHFCFAGMSFLVRCSIIPRGDRSVITGVLCGCYLIPRILMILVRIRWDLHSSVSTHFSQDHDGVTPSTCSANPDQDLDLAHLGTDSIPHVRCIRQIWTGKGEHRPLSPFLALFYVFGLFLVAIKRLAFSSLFHF
jgi:hypothetical protein